MSTDNNRESEIPTKRYKLWKKDDTQPVSEIFYGNYYRIYRSLKIGYQYLSLSSAL